MQQRGTRAPGAPEKLPERPRRPFPVRDLVAIVVLGLASVAVYLPIGREPGPHALAGAERAEPDLRRIAFAREALISKHPYLPTWDARQFTGVPFAADLRNLPWIPNRLALLVVPESHAYDVGVALAAALAAIFTYAYARRLGFAALPSAVAGWTFAAAQLLATRVAAGELAVVETFCALPLLLWLVERCVQAPPDQPGKSGRALLPLGLATMCVVLAGDFHLPAVAILLAAIYALYRAGHAGLRAVLAMLLGIGCAAFALWPMLLLNRRTVEILPRSDQPSWQVLLGDFVLPRGHGAYIGWIPLAALGFVLLAWLKRGWPRNRVWLFLTISGTIALATSLLLQGAGETTRWSVAIQSLPTFVLAITLGLAIQLLLLRFALKRAAAVYPGIALLIALHLVDVVWHDRAVIGNVPLRAPDQPPTALTLASLEQRVGEGRVAIDPALWGSIDAARQLDDLSAPGPRIPEPSQRALADMNGAPLPSGERAAVDASALSPAALSAAGVRLVLTRGQRPDLLPAGGTGDARIYRVPEPASRAAFYPTSETQVVPAEQIHERLRRGEIDPRRTLLLPTAPPNASSAAPVIPPDQSWAAAVRYRRARGDEISLKVTAGVSGYVRVLESFDPGWRAAIDGQATPVLAADDAWLAIAVPQGAHEVTLRYETPGARAGAIATGISFVMLLLVSFLHGGKSRPAEPPRRL